MSAPASEAESGLAAFEPRDLPGAEPLEGRLVTVEPIFDDRRFGELFGAFRADEAGTIWRWLSAGPFSSEADFLTYASEVYFRDAHRFYHFIPKATGQSAGVAALFRADRPNGVIEVGHICFGPSLQRTPAATEGLFLIARYALGALGYRRLEWKCDNENEPSKRAAERLGFRYEGLFRQHMVVKGRNRNTAWYSILDREWPALEPAFERWLDPASFDSAGRQRRPLGDLTAEALAAIR
ncbi:GCN5-related N-acetyltransferase [Fulvimarina pelagi HTCC2506]|uniref:GCN5-related N-acetyltransferase n=1 Tax=Fulvimarina pelagi HTCC2506 TaxID=314231 RepID=Q0G5R7_9HYPH|nr:GNAT family protein [Fulvimarina pelagi]EAU42997.1 GCN5-related N-acetyltransferase [Fulvimarina pelagi HTCC2506]